MILGHTPFTSWETSWRVKEPPWVQRSTPFRPEFDGILKDAEEAVRLAEEVGT